MANIFVGTSGFTYAHWGSGVFYPSDLPQSKWLEYYTKHFDTVEINSSFYHLPKPSVFASWYGRTPETFTFAVKGNRFITHVKRLKECDEPIERFFASATELKEKLSVVLWQLPPGLHADTKRLESFCKLLVSHKVSRDTRHAFEFRHESWFTDSVYHVLGKYDVACSIAHSRRYPFCEVVTAGFVYLRFHGSNILYASSYSDEELSSWAKKIRVWVRSSKDVFAYFNNDASGFAIRNAQTLKRLLG